MARAFPERQPFLVDLPFKLGALGLAIILWVVSISDISYTADVEFPLEIRNLREGKALSEETPRMAVLRFRSSARTLIKLHVLLPFYPPKLVLDLERVQRRHVFYLDEYLGDNPQRIDIPIAGIKNTLTFVEVIQPDSVLIVLGDYVEKRVPVRPQVTIQPASGYTQVGKIIVTPSQVLVKGVDEEVRRVEVILSMRQSYPNVTEPLDLLVGVQHPNPGKVLDVEPVNVNIKVDVQMISERRLDEVPVRIINVPSNLAVYVSPSTVSLTLAGGVDYLANLDSTAVEVFVDYQAQWSPTNLFIEPQVRIDSNLIEYRDLVPKQLEIISTRQPL